MIPVATLLVGAVGGYFSGKDSTAGDGKSAQLESTTRTRSSGRSEGPSAGEIAKKVRNTSTEKIARMPGNTNRIQSLIDFYSSLTPEQLAEEASKLEGLPLNERIMASFLLFGQWAEVDPTAAMAFSNTMGFAAAFVRPTILQSWASTDPANAAKYYAQNPREFAMMGLMGGGRGPMGGQGGAAAIIATEWARQDPAAAMAWAASLTTEKSQAMSSVITEIAKSDPAKAVVMLAQLAEADRPGAYATVAKQYGTTDFGAAQTWIRSLPVDQQADAMAAAIGGLANVNPEQAIKELAQMAPGEARNDLIPDLVRDLARKDPQAAADFLKTQDSEKAQRQSMRELIPALNGQSPTAALNFVNSLAPGAVRDSAAQAYVWSNNTGAPTDLITVAESITDEGDRTRAIGIAAMRWMHEDPAAAKSYIQASTVLSEEAKQRISEGGSMWGGGDRGGRGGPRGGRGN